MMNLELTKRQETILRLVVQDYIRTAAPISSKAICAKYNLGLSSATVRNDLADLEEQGYLTHPYTSAGRIPTDTGYRYFVRRLMEESNLSSTEQRMIRHQFHQARMDLDQWIRLAAAVLARSAQGASLVTAPKADRSHFKHLELVSIREELALVILLLQEGTVKQQVLMLGAPRTQDELNPIAHHLADIWQNLDVLEIKNHMLGLTSLEVKVAQIIINTMEHIDSSSSAEIYHDGLMNIINQPEFASGGAIQPVIRALEERQIVETMIGETLRSGGVQIIIGGEGRWQDFSDIGIVLARYGVEEGATGALGVLGPLRMPYSRAISVVRYMATLMSDLISDLYG
jgi:heat-inducible transcriptional repressor